jgi:hypothetical protein
MRVLFWYCNHIGWTPAVKTLDEAPDAKPGVRDNVVVAFVHVEPGDVEPGASAETKLIKNAKWLARKWETKEILLHSFTHLSEEKAEPAAAQVLLSSAQERLNGTGYVASQTPYGYFLDLDLKAPGKPLARIYKEW